MAKKKKRHGLVIATSAKSLYDDVRKVTEEIFNKSNTELLELKGERAVAAELYSQLTVVDEKCDVVLAFCDCEGDKVLGTDNKPLFDKMQSSPFHGCDFLIIGKVSSGCGCLFTRQDNKSFARSCLGYQYGFAKLEITSLKRFFRSAAVELVQSLFNSAVTQPLSCLLLDGKNPQDLVKIARERWAKNAEVVDEIDPMLSSCFRVNSLSFNGWVGGAVLKI